MESSCEFSGFLTYRKGHQGSNPGGHSFVFLKISINNKPDFVSEVVRFSNGGVSLPIIASTIQKKKSIDVGAKSKGSP
jgi:hypothetical protein